MENEPQTTHIEEHRERTPVSFPGAPKPKKKNVGIKIVILITLLLVIGLIAWFLLKSDSPFSSATVTPTPMAPIVEAPTEIPSPTAPPVSKEDLKVQVLNGTGVPGEAAFLQKEMEKLGFKTIETGNADTKDYTKTDVSFSSRVPESVRTEVTTKLQDLYSGINISDTSAAGADIKIITGTRKGQTAKVSPTPTTKTTPTPTSKVTGSISPTTTGSTTVTPTKTPTPTPTKVS